MLSVEKNATAMAAAATAVAAALVANNVTRCRDPLSGNDPLGKPELDR